MCLFLTGCDLHSSSHNLVVCGSYGVPGMFCRDLRGGTYDCEVLETDSYGRIMFSYTTESCITEKEESVTVICQVSDSEHVYYYEDLCYLWGEASEDGIAELKDRNDWECELDFTKMIKRENEVSYDLVLITRERLESDEIKDVICEELEIEKNSIEMLCFCDKNMEGQELYFVKIQKEDILYKYYMMVNTKYEICYIEVEDGDVDLSTVVTFKQDNGWAYE